MSQSQDNKQPQGDVVAESSPPQNPGLSLSHVPPEARELFNMFDGMAELRDTLRTIAETDGHWAGLPLPLKDVDLIVEPNYPNAERIMEATKKPPEEDPAQADPTFRWRNKFWSMRRRRTVYVWEAKGKVDWGLEPPAINQVSLMLNTMEASAAWGIEQESNALVTLGTVVKHVAFKHYLLTGSFLETSKKSGVHYLFRRLRPTLALSSGRKGGVRVIAALCLHPIAYYADSWAGAMCPTDDVLAHLMLMRGDEHMFWRRANQHPAWTPQAGIG